ncbi:DUF6913 domain-containing protein [Aureibacter tunicatorum]|uniref:Uncharacterized protein n=1 Tax=Aureibacter tunicatorum TaxID=866807 RepID=A0AAE3XRW7_9BACT|nr:hypothetical protein [Aureibacter tunicatorum]MDR6240899.1 hypothetical protein [Aureibacter tunicatorum]BDD03679.1 hypothetical protein AUTU_11620 [Aureibacter tunicatorum]
MLFLKKALINRKAQTLAEKRRESISLSQAKNIIVLSTALEDNDQSVNKFIRQLVEEGKNVLKVICFVDGEKEQSSEQVVSVGYEDFRWNGAPNSEEVANLIVNDYDILFHVDEDINPLSIYMLNKLKTKFKIGYYQERYTDFYDMMIMKQDDEKSKSPLDEMLYYSKKI